jgi:ATP-dependent Clp protease ATP-binding subunit ClpB
VYGARPLRRVIERRIANPLSKRILAGDFAEGATVMVSYADGEYTFEEGPAKVSKKKELVAAR